MRRSRSSPKPPSRRNIERILEIVQSWCELADQREQMLSRWRGSGTSVAKQDTAAPSAHEVARSPNGTKAARVGNQAVRSERDGSASRRPGSGHHQLLSSLLGRDCSDVNL